MNKKDLCQYCESEAKFNDLGIDKDNNYAVVSVCTCHFTNYHVS
jgi:hypothetical protein